MGIVTVERPVTLPQLTETKNASVQEIPSRVETGNFNSKVPSAINARKP